MGDEVFLEGDSVGLVKQPQVKSLNILLSFANHD